MHLRDTEVPLVTTVPSVRRDTLYRLSLGGLTQLEKASWPAPPEKVEMCQNKGQTEASCHNFVKVLLAGGKRIFSCGTNAFSPQCSWRAVSTWHQQTESLAVTGNVGASKFQ